MPLFRILVLCGVAILSAGLPAVAQTTARGAGLLPEESMLNRRGLTRRWWGHAVINSQRDKLLFMTADEKYLFLQSTAGVITAFDSETGRQLWARPIGSRDRAIFPAAMNDEHLFVINGLKMFAVKKTNGDNVWELTLPSQPSSSPTVDEQRAYVGFLDGSMYAFDLAMIRQLHSQGKLPQYSAETVVWRYPTSQAITIPAVVDGPLVAFASRNGSLYSVSASERKLVFQFETDARVSAPIVHYKQKVLLASEDSNLYSINLTNGKSNWMFTTGIVIRKSPVLVDDEVYLLPERGNMYKLSVDTGKELWPQPQQRIRSFLSAGSTRLYVIGQNDELQILSRQTGAREGAVPLERFKHTVANDRSDRIFMATESGLVICLHELGRDFPRFHLHPERQPVLPEFAPDDFDFDAPADAEAAAD